MKRITILMILTALLMAPAYALSVKKKSIRKVATNKAKIAGPVFKQAVDAYEDEDFSTASSLINKYLAKNPKDADAWAYKAAIYSEMEEPQEAIKAMNNAKNYGFGRNDNEMLNWMYFTRSTINLQLKDTLNAIEDLNMALRYDNKDLDSYFRRANIYKRLRRFDEALVDYGMIVQYDPKEIEGYLGIGTVSGSLKKRKEAIKAFSKAIELDPDNGEPYALRAVEYYNDWDFEKSAKDVVRALEREHDNARALWVLEYLKQNEDATKDLNKVFKDKAKKSKDPSWLDLLKD